LLYRGSRLATAPAHTAAALTDTARGFLAAAAAAERGSRRRGQIVRAGLALLGVVALVLAGTAFILSADAAHQRDDAVYASVLAQADRLETLDPDESAQLDLVARHLRPGDRQVRDRLLATANLPLSHVRTGHSGTVTSVTFSPDGTVLASTGADGTLRLWNVADPRHPSLLSVTHVSAKNVSQASFSPNGALLATTSDTVRLWDIRHPDRPRLLSTLTASSDSYGIGFSPDGTVFASGSGPGSTINFTDISDPSSPRAVASEAVGSSTSSTSSNSWITLSADWRAAAVSTSEIYSGSTTLWRVGDPRSSTPLTAAAALPIGSIALALGSHGDRLAAQNEPAGTVREWNIADLDHPTPLGAATAPVSGVSSGQYDSAERTLAVATVDGTVIDWNLDDPIGPHPSYSSLSSSTGNTLQIAVPPDGRTLAGGNLDGTVQLWSLPATTLGGQNGEGLTPVFDAPGDVMATTTVSGVIQLWDSHDHTSIHRITRWDHEYSYNAAISADGRSLAVDSQQQGDVDLFDVATRSPSEPIARIPLNNVFASPVYSRDGHLLFAQSVDKSGTAVSLDVWDVRDPGHPSLVGRTPMTSRGNTGALSPDGHTIVTGGFNGAVSLIDVSDPTHPAAPVTVSTEASSENRAVALSPDGRTLVSGGDDGAIRIFDIADPRHPHLITGPLPAHDKVVWSLSFSPDGRTLASAGLGGKVLLWDMTDRGHPATSGRSIVPRAFSPWWRIAFAPTGSLLAGAGEAGALQYWDLDPSHAARRICELSDPIDPRQWHELLPDLPYFRTC
jgi:WD40 repeat protein